MCQFHRFLRCWGMNRPSGRLLKCAVVLLDASSQSFAPRLRRRRFWLAWAKPNAGTRCPCEGMIDVTGLAVDFVSQPHWVRRLLLVAPFWLRLLERH